MKIHRFFGPFTIDTPSTVVDDKETVHQMATVLRLEHGEHVVLFDGSGYEAEYAITHISKKSVALTRIEYRENTTEPRHPIVLGLALLKKENFELAVQKAVEAGVTEIVPIKTERTVKTGLNSNRLEKIVKEAAEQSGRGKVPVLHEPLPLSDAVQHLQAIGTVVLLDKDGGSIDTLPVKPTAIIVGPEGGFTDKEVAFAQDNGIPVASLGPRTLRAETAAIVGTYMLSI